VDERGKNSENEKRKIESALKEILLRESVLTGIVLTSRDRKIRRRKMSAMMTMYLGRWC